MKHLICEIIPARRCNLRCGYCGVWRQNKPELPVSKWKEILTTIKPNVGIVNIYGGEPTLYPQLSQLIDILNKLKIYYTLSTNCTTNNLFSLLPKLKSIAISIDSTKKWFDTDSKKKSGEGISLVKLLSMNEQYKLDKFVGITVTNQNADEVPSLVRWLSKRGWVSCINPLHARKSSRSITSKVQQVKASDSFKRLGKILVEMTDKGFLLSSSREYYEQWKTYASEQNWKCDDTVAIMIDCDGTLNCCRDYTGKRIKSFTYKDIGSKEFTTAYLPDVKECKGCFIDCYYLAKQILDRKVKGKELIGL